MNETPTPPACPDCGAPLAFDKGTPPTHMEPGEAPCWYCESCGGQFPADLAPAPA